MSVGAVYDRASFLESNAMRAVIDRAYKRFAVTWTRSFLGRISSESSSPFLHARKRITSSTRH